MMFDLGNCCLYYSPQTLQSRSLAHRWFLNYICSLFFFFKIYRTLEVQSWSLSETVSDLFFIEPRVVSYAGFLFYLNDHLVSHIEFIQFRRIQLCFTKDCVRMNYSFFLIVVWDLICIFTWSLTFYFFWKLLNQKHVLKCKLGPFLICPS